MEKINTPLFDSIVDSIWMELPKYIQWLLRHRKNRQPIYGINLSIILHSCTLIEGFIYDVLEEEIGSPSNAKLESLEDRLYYDLCLKLQSASWSNYVKLFELITGHKLSKLTKNETWKGILILFQLRNMMTHGKSIEITIDRKNKESLSLSNNYSLIENYLKEVGIKSPILPVPTTPFVSNESADHFFNLTQSFLKDLHQNYLVQKKGKTWVAYEIAFEE